MTDSIENAEVVTYPRDLVFAAACAAQRMNGEYVKRTAPQYKDTTNTANKTKLPNSTLMKAILSSGGEDILKEDYEYSQLVRDHFCSLISSIFDGSAKDFVRLAVEAATIESVTLSGQIFGVIASLPSVYEYNIRRKKEREELSEYIEGSTPLNANIEDSVKLNITVIDTKFNKRFNTNAVNGVINNTDCKQVVFFFIKKSLVKGKTYNITGRIKNKNQQTTQLHRVYVFKS